MNLEEAQRSNFAVFDKMGAEKRKAQIQTVQYIEMLSVTTNTRTRDWDIKEIFGLGEGNELVTAKNEINKRFFEQVAKVKGSTPSEVIDIEPKIQARIDEITKESSRRAMASLQRDADACYANISDYHRRIHDLSVKAFQKKLAIDAMKGKSLGLSSQVVEISKSSFWKFHSFADDRVKFVTRNDVVLKQVNKMAGVDIQVNMGKFVASVDMHSLFIVVLMHENNLVRDSFFHPHVHRSGEVCWGDGVTAVDRLTREANLVGLMDLLASNLTNYNDKNPYVSLYHFHETSLLPNRGQNVTVRYESSSFEDDPETYYCDICDGEYEEGSNCDCTECDECGVNYNSNYSHECEDDEDEDTSVTHDQAVARAVEAVEQAMDRGITEASSIQPASSTPVNPEEIPF